VSEHDLAIEAMPVLVASMGDDGVGDGRRVVPAQLAPAARARLRVAHISSEVVLTDEEPP
jgi:hypothetical protein